MLSSVQCSRLRFQCSVQGRCPFVCESLGLKFGLKLGLKFAPLMFTYLADSESEKSFSGFETVTSNSFEDSVHSSDTITSSMSEEKACKTGETLSNGIKKHR